MNAKKFLSNFIIKLLYWYLLLRDKYINYIKTLSSISNILKTHKKFLILVI